MKNLIGMLLVLVLAILGLAACDGTMAPTSECVTIDLGNCPAIDKEDDDPPYTPIVYCMHSNRRNWYCILTAGHEGPHNYVEWTPSGLDPIPSEPEPDPEDPI